MRSMEIKKWFFRTNIGYLSNNACTCVHVYFVEVAHRPLWIPFTSYRYSRVWYKTPIPYFRWWFSNFIRSEHQMKNQCFSITWTMILPLSLPMCVFMHTSSVCNGINPINFIYFNNWKINENRYYNQLVGHSEASFWRKWPSMLFFDATHEIAYQIGNLLQFKFHQTISVVKNPNLIWICFSDEHRSFPRKKFNKN